MSRPPRYLVLILCALPVPGSLFAADYAEGLAPRGSDQRVSGTGAGRSPGSSVIKNKSRREERGRNYLLWVAISNACRAAKFMGVLKDPDTGKLKRSKLLATKYLPSLNGVVWRAQEDGEETLDKALQLFFRRHRVDFKY